MSSTSYGLPKRYSHRRRIAMVLARQSGESCMISKRVFHALIQSCRVATCEMSWRACSRRCSLWRSELGRSLVLFMVTSYLEPIRKSLKSSDTCWNARITVDDFDRRIAFTDRLLERVFIVLERVFWV